MRQSRSPSPQMLKANPRGSVSTHHVNRANRVQNDNRANLSRLIGKVFADRQGS